jgi:hypothetical protein
MSPIKSAVSDVKGKGERYGMWNFSYVAQNFKYGFAK